MTRINATKAVQNLKTELKKVGEPEKIQISDIKNKKLRTFARDVAGSHSVNTSCGGGGTRVKNSSITPAKLKKEISRLEKDLKKADKNKDDFIDKAEGKGLSKAARNLLDFKPARYHAPVRTGC